MAWESKSGAKSSFEMPRYDLIYFGFIERLAARLGYGAAKHGENNYQQGVGDAVYRRDRVNHLIAHAHKLASATDKADIDKHLGAIAANCQIIAFLDDAVQESAPFIKSEQAGKLNSLGCARTAYDFLAEPPTATATNTAQGDGDYGEPV